MWILFLCHTVSVSRSTKGSEPLRSSEVASHIVVVASILCVDHIIRSNLRTKLEVGDVSSQMQGFRASAGATGFGCRYRFFLWKTGVWWVGRVLGKTSGMRKSGMI